jgi:tetratricopeptide (TPR) repeat protein
MNPKSKLAAIVSFAVLAVSAIVYFLTMTPTVPFWDSGEFIAVSKILGIPHPPGTPLFVLIGRVATLIPIASIAQRVNAVSAVAAALSIFFTYLCILRLMRLTQGGERQPWHEWAAVAGAACGALMFAFSDNFWENSIEAEVYQLMSLASILVFWLGLKWWEEHDRKPTVAPLLLATYVMWLSVGLHLGVGVMGAPLLVLVAMVDWRVAMIFAMPFVALLRVPAGLEHMAGAILIIAAIQNIWFASERKLPGWMLMVNLVGSAVGVYYAEGSANFTLAGAIIAAIGLFAPYAWLARKHREGRILLLILGLMVLGYSTHLYLPIRAALHPAINEGAPATWDRLRDLLERKQYGEMNMFVRRAALEVQLNKEFWRYFGRQWPIFPGNETPWSALLPLLLGVAGGVWQAMRDRRGFAYTFVFFGLNTAGLIVFLNFSDHEVRDRDYFFQSGYHAYALWIGVGVAWLIGWIRESFGGERNKNLATLASAGLLCVQPFLLMNNLWFKHDRSHNYVARDYAYDMLAPLAPNSFIFTNGDNDTFPLWYIQQVEGFRKDVRIVNLSLLNTDWYIRQLRDEYPKVPIDLDDRTVDALGAGAIQDSQGRVVYTNEFMVHHILEQDRRADGSWKQTPYFAVTVPEHYGYDPLFSLQGLVYEVKTDSTKAGIDVAATRKALYETFQYRGLFKADGSWDSTVYKDENSETLSRNYAAAHLQLALHYRRAGDMKSAIAEMERIARMFPTFTELQVPLGSFYLDAGDTAKALALFAKLAKLTPNNPEVRYYNGAGFALRGNIDAAIAEFEAAISLDPDYGQPYYSAYYTLRTAGQRERAVQYLQRWIDGHPGDTQAASVLQAERAQLGIRGTPNMPPPALQLP